MRIRTALAVTALAAATVLGAGGTALAHNDDDMGYQGGFTYENLGGPAGITEATGHRSEGGYDRDGHGGSVAFAYQNLGDAAGITKAAGHGEGNFDEQYDD
jgi:hypothetical protein